jgi:regulator of replication initiation timing
METQELEDNLNELIEENRTLKLRIAELEKQLEKYTKQQSPKKLVPPENPIYTNDAYFYWI